MDVSRLGREREPGRIGMRVHRVGFRGARDLPDRLGRWRGRGCGRGVERFGDEELTERDGVGVAAGSRVSLVEKDDDGALAGRPCKKTERRAVLRLERAERTGRCAQGTEDDGDARRADAPGPKELVAERGVSIAGAREAGSGRPASRELALDGVVEGIAEASPEGRTDPLELGHDHPRHSQRAAFRVAFDGLPEREAAGAHRVALCGRGEAGCRRERRASVSLSNPGVVHSGVVHRFAGAGRNLASTASCSHVPTLLAQFLAPLTGGRPMLCSESFPLQVRDCRHHMDPEQPRTRGAMSAR